MELTAEQLRWIVELTAKTAVEATLQTLEGNVADVVRNACKAGADALLKEQTTIRKRERARSMDKRLHNTRLLLKNYRLLKEHFKSAVYKFEEEQSADELKPGDIWRLLNDNAPEEVYIESICKSATRTMIILQHIDKMLGIYEAYCESSSMQSAQRQYRILKAYYLQEPQVSMADIADAEHVHRRTAERDLDAAIEGLTALIFGIDSIKDLTRGGE